jgi:hypothetical protein
MCNNICLIYLKMCYNNGPVNVNGAVATVRPLSCDQVGTYVYYSSLFLQTKEKSRTNSGSIWQCADGITLLATSTRKEMTLPHAAESSWSVD